MVVAADGIALLVPGVVVTALLVGSVRSGASPVAATGILLSEAVCGLGTGETGCGKDAVAPEAAMSFDAPALGNCAGRLVSFRCGERLAGPLTGGRGGVAVSVSRGATSTVCRWIKLWDRGDTVVSPAKACESMMSKQNPAVTNRHRRTVARAQGMKSSFFGPDGVMAKRVGAF